MCILYRIFLLGVFDYCRTFKNMAQVLLHCGYRINIENGLVSSFINETNQRFNIVVKSGNLLPFVLKFLLHIFHMPTDIIDLFNSLYHYKKDYLKLFPEDSINCGIGFLNQNFEIVDSLPEQAFTESTGVFHKTPPEIICKLQISSESRIEETFDMEPTIERKYINKLIYLRKCINRYIDEEYNFETFSSEIFIIYFAYLCEGKPFPIENEYHFNYFTGNSHISYIIDFIISEFYSFVPSEKQREKFLPAIFLQLFLISCTDINRFFPSFLKKVFVYRSFIKYNDERFRKTNSLWRLTDLLSDEKSSTSFRQYLLLKEKTRNYILIKIEYKMKIKDFFLNREDFSTLEKFRKYTETKNINFTIDIIRKIHNSIKELMKKEENEMKKIIKTIQLTGGGEAAYCSFEISAINPNLKLNEIFIYYLSKDPIIKDVVQSINFNCLKQQNTSFLSNLSNSLLQDVYVAFERRSQQRDAYLLATAPIIILPNGSQFLNTYLADPNYLLCDIDKMKQRFEELMRGPFLTLLPKEIVRLHDCPVCLIPCELITVTCHRNHGICLDCFNRTNKLNHGIYICVLCRQISSKKSK